EILGARNVASRHPEPGDLGPLDTAAHDVIGEAATDHLDLRQLRHQIARERSAVTSDAASARSARRRSSVCQASFAAFCSASFLLRPCPSPRTSAPRMTRAWNSFSWSGPCSATRYSGAP